MNSRKEGTPNNDWQEVLGSWVIGEGPLYRRLAAAFRAAVAQGDLPRGSLLPPERSLARTLMLSRGTVVGAYNLLKEEGWLESRQGSGTLVARTAREAAAVAEEERQTPARSPNGLFRRLIEGPSSSIDLSVASPPAAEAVGEAVAALAEDGTALFASHGYASGGLDSLREAVAAHFRRQGVATSREQVLITTGVQQALSLVAALYIRPGETAIVENPTYPGALDALRTAGAHLRSIPIDEAGARVDLLEALVTRMAPRLVYLTPTFNNPTGTVMTRSRRRTVARLAAEHQVPVIEDLALAEIVLGGEEPPPPIAGFSTGGLVITVGSASKSLWGGLRIGWLRAPEGIIMRLLRLKVVADLGSPLLDQLIVARLLPRMEEVQARRRAELLPRLDRLTTRLKELLPSWTWQRPAGGLSLWVRLPHGNAAEFAQMALRHGVTLVAGPQFSADESHEDCLRIPFALSSDDLEEGVRRLARAWAAYEPGRAGYAAVREAIV